MVGCLIHNSFAKSGSANPRRPGGPGNRHCAHADVVLERRERSGHLCRPTLGATELLELDCQRYKRKHNDLRDFLRIDRRKEILLAGKRGERFRRKRLVRCVELHDPGHDVGGAS